MQKYGCSRIKIRRKKRKSNSGWRALILAQVNWLHFFKVQDYTAWFIECLPSHGCWKTVEIEARDSKQLLGMYRNIRNMGYQRFSWLTRYAGATVFLSIGPPLSLTWDLRGKQSVISRYYNSLLYVFPLQIDTQLAVNFQYIAALKPWFTGLSLNILCYRNTAIMLTKESTQLWHMLLNDKKN